MAMGTGKTFAQGENLHAAWDRLLSTYVVESADGVNRFDYSGLQANQADRDALSAYLAQFESFDMDSLDRDGQFAAWSNIYNALTVQHIIERYPVRSIRANSFSGPWKRVKTVVGGVPISLDAIEHEILRPMGDARVHYAINCASYSCPNLMPSAWQAATLDLDLDAAAAAYINHPRGVQVRPRGGLLVSDIYKWFREDFGGSENTVIAHFLKYAEPDLAADIRANADIKRYAYDWSLNDAAAQGKGT